MKYKFIIDCPRGQMESPVKELTDQELDEAKKFFKQVVEFGNYFTMDTTHGIAFMSKEMIQQSVFLIQTVEE